MLLSIAMIVKNEEKFLRKTLNALLPLLNAIKSELVILDTGSEDDTISIAKQFTDNVYSVPWENDFAYMRNISLKKCKGEWILVVDADEVLENPEGIIDFFNEGLNKKFNSAAVSFKNVTSDKDKNYIIGSLIRLFKNSKELKYEGRVHEQVKFQQPTIKLNAVFKHYGYNNNDFELMIYKFERNLELLMKNIEENPEDVYTIFQLAQTYSMARKSKEAFKWIKYAYELSEQTNNLNKYLYVYHFYAKELFANGDYIKTAEICEKVLKNRGGYLDFYYLLGISYIRRGLMDKALEVFHQYLKIRNNYENYEGFRSSAVVDFSHARKDEIIINIISILFNNKQYKEIVMYYKEIQDKSQNEEMDIVLLVSCILTHNKKEIILWLENREYKDREIEKILASIEKAHLIANIDDNFIDIFRNLNSNLDITIDLFVSGKLTEGYERIDYNNFYRWKAEILKEAIKIDYENIFLINNLSKSEKESYIRYVSADYYIIRNLVCCLEKNILTKDITILELLIVIGKVLLTNNSLSEEKLEEISYIFLAHKLNLIEAVYDKDSLNVQNISFIGEKEDVMALKIFYAMKLIFTDKLQYLKNLKIILKENEQYSSLIELLLKNVSDLNISSDMMLEKDRLLKMTETLIEEGNISLAEEVLKELYKLFKFNTEVLNSYAIILFMNKMHESSLKMLCLSLVMDSNYFDTNYNIAVVLEALERYEDAKLYYKKSHDLCNDDNINKLIEEKIF